MRLTARPYESERDLQQMQDLLMKARSRTDDWRYMHIGELTFGFFIDACRTARRIASDAGLRDGARVCLYGCLE